MSQEFLQGVASSAAHLSHDAASKVAHLSRRATEYVSSHASDYILDQDAKLLDGPDDKFTDLTTVLESPSSHDHEKIAAMKKLIAMITKGRDASILFPTVIKLVSTPCFDLRRLVYIHVLRYAEQEQSVALLAINSFQRDIHHESAVIRALAIRVLSGMRVQVVAGIVALAIEKCAMDPSVHVRKAAALAIIKCCEVDEGQVERMVEVLKVLFADRSPFTLGCTVRAFQAICPDRMDLVHPFYRRLCFALMDGDEWSQCALLELLTRYARMSFKQPGKGVRRGKVDERHFYSSDEEEASDTSDELDKDHELLLTCAEPLLASRHAGVVMGAVGLFVHVGTSSDAGLVVQPLMRLLKQSSEGIQQLILTNINALIQHHGYREHFMDHYRSFYVTCNEPLALVQLKLDILPRLVNETSVGHVLKELQFYVWERRPEASIAAIQAISACGQHLPAIADLCMTGLLNLIQSGEDHLMCASIVHIKALVMGHSTILARLVGYFSAVDESAQCSLLQIAAIQHNPLASIQLLKSAVKQFPSLGDSVKHQVLTLSTKLLSTTPSDHQLRLLFLQVIDYCKYDQSPDLRDRARLWRTMAESWGVVVNVQLMQGVPQLQGKPLSAQWSDIIGKKMNVKAEGGSEWAIGTLGMQMGRKMDGWRPLPRWTLTPVDPTLRTLGHTSGHTEQELSSEQVSSKEVSSDEGDFYSDSSSNASSNPWHNRALADHSD